MENLEEKFCFSSMERTSQMIDDEREHYQKIMEKIRIGISSEESAFINEELPDNGIVTFQDIIDEGFEFGFSL